MNKCQNKYEIELIFEIWSRWLLFLKYGTSAMLLEVTTILYFLISYI
jgi:hypothetical protein